MYAAGLTYKKCRPRIGTTLQSFLVSEVIAIRIQALVLLAQKIRFEPVGGKQTCQAAPHGHVLAQAEMVALVRGRELTRQALEAVLNQQAEAAEKKGRRDGPAPAKAPAKTKARRRGR